MMLDQVLAASRFSRYLNVRNLARRTSAQGRLLPVNSLPRVTAANLPARKHFLKDSLFSVAVISGSSRWNAGRRG